MVPGYLSKGFILIGVGLAFYLFYLAKYAVVIVEKEQRKNHIISIIAVIVIWIFGIGVVSQKFSLISETMLPPPMMIMVMVPTLACVFFVFSKGFTPFLNQLNLMQLTVIQAFRIIVELLLYSLSVHEVFGEHLTFAGYNFDILIGVFALLLIPILNKGGKSKLRLLTAFNIVGILVLLNIVILVALSIPSPLQVFTEGSSTIISTMPFLWLPAFMVPLAFTFHFASLKKIRLLRKVA